MPYKLSKKDGKICVLNSETGENKGCSDTLKQAKAHMRALYANTSDSKERIDEETIDALIEGALKEFDDELGDETKEKELEKHYSYVGLAKTFAELNKTDAAREFSYKASDLIHKLPGLIENNLADPELEDKGGVIVNLANELVKELDLLQADVLVKEDKEVITEENKSFLKKIEEQLSKLTDAVFPKEKNENGVKEGIYLYKDTDTNEYHWIARYSNNLKDRDNDIISAKSHRRFVERVESGLAPYPELWLWHVKDWRIGQADVVMFDDVEQKEAGFAIAKGHFLPGCQPVAEWLEKQRDQLGVSHGMPKSSIVRDDADPRIIVEHETREISPLPAKRASNLFTGFVSLGKEVNEMSIPEDKKKALIKSGLSEDILSRIEEQNSKDADAAEEKGLEAKEANEETATVEETAEATQETGETSPDKKEEKATDEDPLEQYPTRSEVVDAIAPMLKEINEKIGEINDRLGSVENAQKENSKQTNSLAKTITADSTPASLFSMLVKGVSGSDDAEVSEEEAGQFGSPKETKESFPGPTPVPFINGLISGDRELSKIS